MAGAATVPRLNEKSQREVLALAAFQAGDAVACAIPNPFITWALDNVDCPAGLRRALPVVKVAAAAGLLVGLRQPRLGRLTCRALQGYFVAALGLHARSIPKHGAPVAALHAVPAAFMLAASTGVGRHF